MSAGVEIISALRVIVLQCVDLGGGVFRWVGCGTRSGHGAGVVRWSGVRVPQAVPEGAFRGVVAATGWGMVGA
jgi:hypothetical protein